MSFVTPEDGWPYPDYDNDDYIDLREGREDLVIDLTAEPDEELLALHHAAPYLFDELSPFEREVVGSRFGFGGYDEQRMKDLHQSTGKSREELKEALGSGLGKIRKRLNP